jgi:steroid 5-alpha reductase family enzyme
MFTNAFLMAGIGAGALLLMMFLIWLISMRINNAGLVDVGWALGLMVLATWYAWHGPGFPARRWSLAGMVVAWGLRLATHLVRRIALEPEDGRYQQLRREWQGSNVILRFLLFFEAQALLDILLSLPILITSLNPAPRLRVLEYAGIALWLVAVVGESIADAQLAAFKRDPANLGHVCQRGLWNYSRHPNYFFEWFVWVAWAVYALASPFGWLAMICPVLMLVFLLRVTGIAATEAQALRSRGEEYVRYQQSTSAFVPWFKKSSAAEGMRFL